MRRVSGCLSLITRLLTYLLAGLLVISVPLSILANNNLRTVFSPDEVSHAVASLMFLSEGLRDRLTDNIVSDIRSDLGSNEGSRTLAGLDPADRLEIAQILFPEDWVITQVQENIGIFMDWIESEEPFPGLYLNLDPLKDNLRGGGSFRIAEIWVDSLATCNAEQNARLDSFLQEESPTTIDFCRPEGELRQRLFDFANGRIIQQLDQMPAEISLLDGIGAGDNAIALDEFRRNILGFLLLMRWLRIMPFLFLGLIMTFTIRSLKNLRTWWGIPVAVGSLFTFAMVLTGNVVGPGILKNTLSQSAQPGGIQEAIVDAVWDLLSTVLNRSAFQALVLLVIVAAAFALPMVLARKGKNNISKPSPEDQTGDRLVEFPPPPQLEPFQPGTDTNTTADDQTSSKAG